MPGKLLLNVLSLLYYTAITIVFSITGPTCTTITPTLANANAVGARRSTIPSLYYLRPSLQDFFLGGDGEDDGERYNKPFSSSGSKDKNNTPVTMQAVLESLVKSSGSGAGRGYAMLLLSDPQQFITDSNIISEKRDPNLDIGTGRSHTGNRVANTLRAQSASYDPVGPGRKRAFNADDISPT